MRLVSVLVQMVLIGLMLSLSCDYFDYSSNTYPVQKVAKVTFIHDIVPIAIDAVNIKIKGDNLDSTTKFVVASNNSFSLFVKPGSNRTFILSAFSKGVVTYLDSLTVQTIPETDTTVLINFPKPSRPEKVVLALESEAYVRINWAPEVHAAAYTIYRLSSLNGQFELIGRNSYFATDYLDTNCQIGKTYHYQIAAWNGCGESDKSIRDSITILAPDTVPEAPRNLVVRDVSKNMVWIAWDKSSRATGYIVYRCGGDALPDSACDTVAQPFFTDLDVLSGATYSYAVSAINKIGESEKSEKITIVTLALVVPSVPVNLAVTTVTARSISITWEKSVAATFYRIYRIEGTGNPVMVVDSTFTLDHVSANLKSGTEYTFAVSAVNTNGASGNSAPVTGKTKNEGTIPPIPENLKAAALSEKSISLSWNASSGATGYVIYRCMSSNGTFTPEDSTAGLSFVSGNLAPKTTYYYKIKAKNQYGSSEFSAAASAVTQDIPVVKPGKPAGVIATALGTSGILIHWNRVANTASYNVYQSSSAGGTFSLIGSGADSFYVNNGLSPNTTYHYQVTAQNTAGESDKSDVVNAKTFAEIAPPAGLAATAASESRIDLSWTASAGAQVYRIYRSLDQSNNFVQTDSTGSTSWSDNGLVASTTYYYKLTAKNAQTVSGFSAVASAKTQQGTLATPTALKATALSTTQIKLECQPVAGATGYKFHFCQSPAGTFTALSTMTSPAYTHASLTANTRYYYKVSATNATGESALSDTVSAMTLQEAVLATPTGLKATPLSSSQIKLECQSVTGATGYKFYFSLSETGTYTALTLVTSPTTTHASLNANTRYYYKVSAVNATGESSQSGVVSAMTNTIQTGSDTLTVTVTTVTYNGNFGPKNASMMWIQKPDKTFVKTICKKAQNYIRYCTLWNTISKGDIDGLTGASRNSHGVLTGKWDCTGQDGKPVPAGTYEFWVEMTENNATGKNSFGSITIDGQAKTVQGTATANFTNFSAVYKVVPAPAVDK